MFHFFSFSIISNIVFFSKMNIDFNPVHSETLLLTEPLSKDGLLVLTQIIPYKSIFMAIRESLYFEVKKWEQHIEQTRRNESSWNRRGSLRIHFKIRQRENNRMSGLTCRVCHMDLIFVKYQVISQEGIVTLSCLYIIMSIRSDFNTLCKLTLKSRNLYCSGMVLVHESQSDTRNTSLNFSQPHSRCSFLATVASILVFITS